MRVAQEHAPRGGPAPWILPSTLDSAIRVVQQHASWVGLFLHFVTVHFASTLKVNDWLALFTEPVRAVGKEEPMVRDRFGQFLFLHSKYAYYAGGLKPTLRVIQFDNIMCDPIR